MKISKPLTAEGFYLKYFVYIYTPYISPAGRGALEINFTAEQPALMQTTA